MMSIRTIIVGILAAICGICATVGVMKLNSGPGPSAKSSIVVAKVDIDIGQKISANLLDSLEWNSDKIPPGAFSSPAEVVDKYSAASIVAGEVLMKGRLTDSPTTLMPAPGMRAYAIEASSASASVGRNLTPGNRVDILWQTSGKLKGALDPISVRLMQNVKILAVGQVDSDLAKKQKSLTLEVRPGMDENIQFAQAFGRLSLSLRNPSDNEGVELVEVRLKGLLEELEAKANQPTAPTAWEAFSEMMGVRMAALEQKLQAPPEKTTRTDRETANRIASGMRATTIRTRDASTGLAGLLEPGDRVDLQLTIDQKTVAAGQYPSDTLIENIEVLAVDADIYNDDGGDGAKKMYRSVTLIVMESMIKDIDRARQLGTLSLTLRGVADSEMVPPRVVISVDDFIAKHMSTELGETNLASAPIKIRTLRGPSVQNMPFATQ